MSLQHCSQEPKEESNPNVHKEQVDTNMAASPHGGILYSNENGHTTTTYNGMGEPHKGTMKLKNMT